MNYPKKAVSESENSVMLPGHTYSVVRYTVDFLPEARKLLGQNNLSALLQKLRDILKSGFVCGERILQVLPSGFDVLILYAGRKETDEKIGEWSHQFAKVLESMGFLGLISFSAGVSGAIDFLTPAALEDVIYQAKYAKHAGQLERNPFVRYYSDEDYQAQRRQRQLELGVWSALRNRQFEVYLQPQYLLDGLKIVGAEALVRWRHPEFGLILPDQFIPFMERDRCILQLDFYMLEECCKILRKWHLDGFPCVPISVNFSRLHAVTNDFMQHFVLITEKYGISPEDLRVEWTESAFTDQNMQVIRIAEQLRSLGYKIAIDDFGKGHSSLSALVNLPVDIIKWDKEFFDFCKNSARHRYFLEQMLLLAHGLGYEVIAEGIEFSWQEKLLQEIGGRYVQGFLYSKPLTLADYEKYALEVEGRVKKYNSMA